MSKPVSKPVRKPVGKRVKAPKSLLSWDDEDRVSVFEDKVYDILVAAMERSDSAAKAIARIQKLLYDQYIENLDEPTLDPQDLADKDGVSTTVRKAESTTLMGEFDQSGFYNLFMGVNTLRLIRSLLVLMDLPHLEEEIMTTMIDNLFGRRPSSGSKTPQTETAVGNDLELLIQQLRKTAERKQRIKKNG